LLSWRKERLEQNKEKMVFTVVLRQNRPVTYPMMMIMMTMMDVHLKNCGA
jgi:hypothetical protein